MMDVLMFLLGFGAGGAFMGSVWCCWYAKKLRRFREQGFDPRVWAD